MSTKSYTEEKVSVSAGNKTTLPKQARRYLGVGVGDSICFKITDSGQVVVESAVDENSE